MEIIIVTYVHKYVPGTTVTLIFCSTISSSSTARQVYWPLSSASVLSKIKSWLRCKGENVVSSSSSTSILLWVHNRTVSITDGIHDKVTVFPSSRVTDAYDLVRISSIINFNTNDSEILIIVQIDISMS